MTRVGFQIRLVVAAACLLGSLGGARPASAEDARKTVLVVGGGYGGLEAATQLAKADGTRVLLIDREANNARITHLPGYVAAGESIETPFRELAARDGFEFQRGEVVGWDAAQKAVRLADGKQLRYDAIIMAVGAHAATPTSIDGVAEHAFGFRTLREASALKKALESRLAKAQQAGKKLEVTVLGAGPSGIELAGALARAHPEAASVKLVHRGEHIKPFGDSTTVEEGRAAETWLHELGVHISGGATPTKVDRHGVEVSATGKRARIASDLVVATVGDVGAGGQLGRTVDARRRVNVDAFLRPDGAQYAFVIGDAAAITDAVTGQPVAQAAKTAKAQGEHAAANALRSLRGEPLVAYAAQPKKPSSAGGVGPGSRVQGFLEKHVGRGPFKR